MLLRSNLHQTVVHFLVDIAERLAFQRIHPVIDRGAQVKTLARNIVPQQLCQFAVIHPHMCSERRHFLDTVNMIA